MLSILFTPRIEMRLSLTQIGRVLRYSSRSQIHSNFSYRLTRFNMTSGQSSNGQASTDTEGLKVAQEVAHEIEEKLG